MSAEPGSPEVTATNKRLVLILGGARSGKSSFAEGLAARLAGTSGGVLFVATAQPGDQEMARRIARHRQARPPGWHTLEEPVALGPAIDLARSVHWREAGGPAVVLVDCLTLWLSNLLIGPEHQLDAAVDEERAEATARAAVERLLAAHRAGTASTLLVSNEVGMGLVPPYLLGRIYRDLLGRVNAWLAAAADEVVLLVAGIPLRIKPGGSLDLPPLPQC